MVEVARNTKKDAQPATEKKLRLLIRQIPASSGGGLSCLGFFIVGAAGFGGVGMACTTSGVFCSCGLSISIHSSKKFFSGDMDKDEYFCMSNIVN